MLILGNIYAIKTTLAVMRAIGIDITAKHLLRISQNIRKTLTSGRDIFA